MFYGNWQSLSLSCFVPAISKNRVDKVKQQKNYLLLEFCTALVVRIIQFAGH